MRPYALLAGLIAASPVSAHALTLEPLSIYKHGSFERSAAEISSYDPASKRLFVVNGEAQRIDVLDIATPSEPKALASVSLAQYGGGLNSVAVKNGMVAAAISGKGPQEPGKVVFLTAADAKVVSTVEVGAMPDNVVFTPDGKYVLTADEGEPDPKYKKDPEGTISIVDVSGGFTNPPVRTADLRAFTWDKLNGVAVAKKGVPFAQDAEPEYIAVSPDSKTAYVALQEVNAIAKVDIAQARVTEVKGLGFKDWSKLAFDSNDRDGGIRFRAWPALGVYQPDGIASYVAGDGKLYIVSANEGDSRDYTELGGSFSNESRVGDVKLDAELAARAAKVADADFGGRLKILNTMGDTDNDGEFEQIYIFGARSMSIWSADTLEQVYDSGDVLERETARVHGEIGFNANHREAGYDNRSDDKGPESEGVAIGVLDGRTYAFVGLERVSGIAIFDVTDPKNASLAAYHNQRDFSKAPSMDKLGDLGPEGVLFISAENSPIGKPLLVVSNEVSSTTRIYEIKP
jgi:hypothetical protein